MAHEHCCPWWLTYTFDNALRRLVHDRDHLFAPFVHPGDRVADVGCGMGFFSLGLARNVGPSGRVLAIDLQPQQLAAVNRRAARAGLRDRIETRLAEPDRLPLDPGLSFVLAFWMLHEVPGKPAFLSQVHDALAPGGTLLVAEPVMHVAPSAMADEMLLAHEAGFDVQTVEGIRLSRAARLVKR